MLKKATATATIALDKETDADLFEQYAATGLLLSCLDCPDEAIAMEELVSSLKKGAKVRITIEVIH